jgi:radical SAM protein with 4Fe4S-binding SPASM domain
LTELKAAFQGREAFVERSGYRLLPFRFNAIGNRYVLTNDVGEYVLLSPRDLTDFVEHRLTPATPVYRELAAKHFLMPGRSRVAVDLLALKYRTRVDRIAEFTALHLFVVTLRCDHSCHYCQVSRQAEGTTNFDMSATHVSTSLDGPKDLHDEQRPLRSGSSYESVVNAIATARRELGPHAVSALMTTTPASLGRVEEIVDEYVRLGFHSIFLRSLSPYGFAAKSLVRRYGVSDWVSFYTRGLRRVLDLAQAGHPIREEYTAILLAKMFSPMAPGYVDLQSPAGIGIGAIVYNYDGSVYASDEGRMLAEMGDTSFRLGHLDVDDYASMMTSEALLGPLEATVLESAPKCTDCAFLPYCGSDPVFHRATQHDWVGHKEFSAFCEKQTSVLEFLVQTLEDSAADRETLLGWVR